MIGEHVVTRSVRDSAALLDATAGDYLQQLMKLPAPARTFLEETARDPGRLRIAFSLDPGLAGTLHPENRTALELTTAALGRLGHELIEVRLPLAPEEFIANYAALVSADVAATLRHAKLLVGREATRDDVELATWILGRLGEAQSAADGDGRPLLARRLRAPVAAVVRRFRRTAHADGRPAADADRRVRAVEAEASGTGTALEICRLGCC